MIITNNILFKMDNKENRIATFIQSLPEEAIYDFDSIVTGGEEKDEVDNAGCTNVREYQCNRKNSRCTNYVEKCQGSENSIVCYNKFPNNTGCSGSNTLNCLLP